jgi:uncharacterized membrane protein YoaK (UPF0700 family)
MNWREFIPRVGGVWLIVGGMSADHISFPRIIPFALSFIAGYVDGVMFLALFGLYVAGATGSFVLVGSYWWHSEPGFFLRVLAIPTFVLGGVVSAVIVEIWGKSRSGLLLTLGLEELFLLGLLLAGLLGLPADTPGDLAALTAGLFGLLAMGMQSAMVRLFMPNFGSTNVLTTTTTNVAIDLTHTLIFWLRNWWSGKEGNDAGARSRLANTLGVVAGFLLGTVIGAFGFVHAGLWVLLVPLMIIDAIVAWVFFKVTDRMADKDTAS